MLRRGESSSSEEDDESFTADDDEDSLFSLLLFFFFFLCFFFFLVFLFSSSYVSFYVSSSFSRHLFLLHHHQRAFASSHCFVSCLSQEDLSFSPLKISTQSPPFVGDFSLLRRRIHSCTLKFTFFLQNKTRIQFVMSLLYPLLYICECVHTRTSFLSLSPKPRKLESETSLRPFSTMIIPIIPAHAAAVALLL